LGIHNAASKGHVERTRALVGEVAVRLELGAEETWTARQAAVLHDIGKIHIPSSILCKPGKLSEHEWEIMRRHPEIGAEMLSGISGLERVRAAVLAHHERFDGRGYPAGLAGDEIPAEARLISVVDAYDAMTNDRPYRKALSHEEAITELEAGAGSQFDPFVVEAVKAVLG
jgi:putative nucleotidyltransferase with HDIG domain